MEEILGALPAAPESPKAKRIEGLGDYLQKSGATDAREKCIYSGARGFLARTPVGQKMEMIGLAQEAVRSKDPISHYVLSWQQGEQPQPAQIEQAVDLFLDELGLTPHQVFYGLHVDTDNVHLHLMINRVHPDTFKVIKPNRGFDLEAAHRAIARIESIQGWRREENGRYRVQADGTVQRDHHADSVRSPADRRPAGSGPRRHASGAQSAERIAIEEGAPLIRAATNWAELHERLAAVGLRYQRKGSGALLWVGETAVKASRTGRDCSLLAVERRLGAYQPAPEGQTVAARLTEPDRPNSPRWREYHAARLAFYAEKQNETRMLRGRHALERQALQAMHRQQRETLYQSTPAGHWRGHGAELNVQRSLLAARQAAEQAVLRERHQQERAMLEAYWRARFLSYEAWLQAHGGSAGWPIELRPPRARLVATEAVAVVLQSHDIRAFVAIVYGRRVDYRRLSAPSGLPGFVDRGREIIIHAETDRETVRAALQLAAQKWGAFQVEGDPAYQRLCVQLAAEHDFKLGNPELQAELNAAHAELQSVRRPRDRCTGSTSGPVPGPTR